MNDFFHRFGQPGGLFRGKAPEDLSSWAIFKLIESVQVRLVYQPVVDLENGTVYAFEALARSNSSHYDSPVDMFHAASKAGLSGRLGHMLRRMAVEECPNQRLFLNVNPNEFDHDYLMRGDDPVFSHLAEVFLEITETVPLSHFQMCHSILEEVRGRGVSLAIDDLGAGFSNLKYIADLEPEIVKFDRSLISNADRSERQRRLMGALVHLCNDMGARVVAEGIETEGELKAVIDSGAHYGQGYYLARPAYPPPLVNWPEAR